MQRDEIVNLFNEILGTDLLSKARLKDEMANGVQILGANEVTKIAFGVSLNVEFLQQAVEWGAQMCVFHHGLDSRTDHSILPPALQKRLRIIFEHNLSILGYHYALDAHPTLGNNAQIIEKLGASISDTLFEEWGFVGKFKSPRAIKSLSDECQQLFNHPVLVFGDENREVQTIGVVSGAGKPYQTHIQEMLDKGVEVYISGETSESVPHQLTESGLNYLLGGHYATEVFGVKALAEAVQTNLGNQTVTIEVKFIDISNPI